MEAYGASDFTQKSGSLLLGKLEALSFQSQQSKLPPL